MFGKGKNVLEAAAKASSDFHKDPKKHEAKESPSHELAEQEGLAEAEDQLCPECHAKIQKFLASKQQGGM
jgi:hypothetical protein